MFEAIGIIVSCVSVVAMFSIVYDFSFLKLELIKQKRKEEIEKLKHRSRAVMAGWETDVSKIKRDRKTYYVFAFDYWYPLIVCCVSEDGYTIGHECHYEIKDCVGFIELPIRNSTECKYTVGVSGLEEIHFVSEEGE